MRHDLTWSKPTEVDLVIVGYVTGTSFPPSNRMLDVELWGLDYGDLGNELMADLEIDDYLEVTISKEMEFNGHHFEIPAERRKMTVRIDNLTIFGDNKIRIDVEPIRFYMIGETPSTFEIKGI